MSEKIVILDEQPAARGYLGREEKGPVYLKYWDRDPYKMSAVVGELERVASGWIFKPIGWELKNPLTGKNSVELGKDAFLKFLQSGFRPNLDTAPVKDYR